MLDFEEEITRFKPSMEVGEVEEAIVREDLTDMTDLMVEFLKNGTEQRMEKPPDSQCLLQPGVGSGTAERSDWRGSRPEKKP